MLFAGCFTIGALDEHPEQLEHEGYDRWLEREGKVLEKGVGGGVSTHARARAA